MPRNPRKHDDRQVAQIARSIETFGFNVPILIDRNGNVVARHGRWLASQKLGFTEVPTIRLEHLTEAQAAAFMLADNRLTELSSWDDRLLGETLKELSEIQLDFSIESTGFTVGEIDVRIEALETDNDDKTNNIPVPPSAIPITKPGDLWSLRNHRVSCGNALDAGAYDGLMQDTRATVVFTDPPFNVKIDGHASGLGKVHHTEFAMASGEMSEDEYISFLTLTCSQLRRHSIDGSIHFICMDWRHAGELLRAGKATYSELKNICVWIKHNAGMGHSIAVSMNSFLFSRPGETNIGTTFNSGNSAGHEQMFGHIREPTHLAERAKREICSRCIRQQNLSASLLTLF
jgi:hypothetical protein